MSEQTYGGIYAGIGSRQTPPEFINLFKMFAKKMAEKNWLLRTGGAEGADTAFQEGCEMVSGALELYVPWGGFRGHPRAMHVCHEVTDRALTIAQQYHPAWGACSVWAKKLHGRNSQIILGKHCDDPCDFVVAWTPPNRGGTTQGIRVAEANGIPVFNLYLSEQRAELALYLNNNWGI